jgi:hypothetical protein
MSQNMEFILGQAQNRLRGRRPAPDLFSDAALQREIRAAAEDLFFHVDRLRASLGWPWEIYEERAYQAVQRAREILQRDAKLSVQDLLAAVRPILNERWPDHLPDLAAARSAVERLRLARATAACQIMPERSA